MLNILFNYSGHFNAPDLSSALPMGSLYVQPSLSIKIFNILGTGTLQDCGTLHIIKIKEI